MLVWSLCAAWAADPLLAEKTREAVARRLADVTVEIVEAEAELAVLQSRNSPATMIELALALDSPHLVPLVEAVAAAESDLARLQTVYGNKMPEVVAANARVESHRAILQQSVETELASRAIRVEMLHATEQALKKRLATP
ncbi:MAG: hypothetical protein H6737_20255 [Alphaproteobacteria bacterium]|nr:hypothetical protein [Alphaproteobacteria bacterium]